MNILNPYRFVSGGYDANEFVTQWEMPDGEFTFPTAAGASYDCDIDFGEGDGWASCSSYDDENFTHTYSSADTYNIRIRGTFSRIYINSSAISNYITRIVQWGDVGFTSLDYAFRGAANLRYCDDDSGTFGSNVAMWRGAFLQTDLRDFDTTNWDLGSCTNMMAAFAYSDAATLNTTNWDVADVEYFIQTFKEMKNLTTIDTAGWNVGSATTMDEMFRNCTALKEIDVSTWDVSNVGNFDNFGKGIVLNTHCYNDLLLNWQNLTLQSGMAMNMGGTKYSSGAPATAKADIISNYSWSFSDGGEE